MAEQNNLTLLDWVKFFAVVIAVDLMIIYIGYITGIINVRT